MAVQEIPNQHSAATRMALSIPVLGWILRDLLHGAADNIYYLLAALMTLWILAVMTWGLVALTLVAVTMVPVIFTLLILITWG
ncbi:hypothetical protein [Primorskyibacter sp. S187A]|uniref:hypothetical protein n=1 Tax=Primorskyibacter sp. S187A TaxID=3415130 RepID=UPI003C7D413B